MFPTMKFETTHTRNTGRKRWENVSLHSNWRGVFPTCYLYPRVRSLFATYLLLSLLTSFASLKLPSLLKMEESFFCTNSGQHGRKLVTPADPSLLLPLQLLSKTVLTFPPRSSLLSVSSLLLHPHPFYEGRVKGKTDTQNDCKKEMEKERTTEDREREDKSETRRKSRKFSVMESEFRHQRPLLYQKRKILWL